MKIETFNELLKTKNPQAYAYVPDKLSKRQTGVNVIYSPNGKIYTYKGTILTIAEKLGLIPEIDIWAESEKAVSQLRNGQQVEAPIECYDTIAYYLNMPGMTINEISRKDNEYGQQIAIYEVAKNLWI